MAIKYDQNFIKTLRQKLTTGNARSVHLNSLPGRYATRLDLSTLSSINEQLPDNFIKTLLSKPEFSFEISLNKVDPSLLEDEERIKINLIAKRLNSLFYDNNDNFLEFGIKTFGFGFPLLIRRDKQNNSSVIAAPLLIWNLDIQKSSSIANKWIVKREEDFPITINEVLISHIQKDENINITRLESEYLEDALIDLDELNSITNKVFNQLGIKSDHSFSEVERCVKDKSELKNLTQQKPWVLWAGIFGLYRSQKESLIQEYDKLLEKPEILNPEELKREHYTTNTVSAVETDPSQVGILNALKNQNQIIIQGPPGCGKSQSLTALISNALVEKKKCLIVCEKKTALDVIYNNLEKIKLDEFCVIVDDVYKDRQGIVKNVRQRIEEIHNKQFRVSKEFESFIGEVNKYREQINKQHLSINHRIFGDSNWTDVVALFLRSNKKSGYKDLNQKLNLKDFKFTYEEYNRLNSILSGATDILKPFGSLKHSLFTLIPSMFSDKKSSVLVKQEIIEKIESINQKLTAINTAQENFIKTYGVELDRFYTTLNSQLNQSLLELYDGINNNLQSSVLFNEHSTLADVKLFVYSLFSSKYKKLKTEKVQFPASYIELINKVNKYRLFEYSVSNQSLEKDFGVVLKEITLLKSKLKEWWHSYPELKNKLSRNIENFQVASGIIFNNQITEVKKNINSLYDEINEQKLYTQQFGLEEFSSFENVSRENARLIILLGDTEEHIDLTKDMTEYYEFVFTLSEREREIVETLFKDEILELQEKFRSWYLFWLLANHESDKPRNDTTINRLMESEIELKKAQLKKISSTWRNEQSSSIDSFKLKNIPIQTLYNLKGSAGNKRNPLRKIISTDFEFFTNFFPVILTNPVACSSIIPLKQNLFDFVIFDEASQLRLEDTFSSIIRGKYKIVSGDKHQMPPSNYFGSRVSIDDAEETEIETEESTFTQSESFRSLADSESLLSFAESSGYRYSPLDIHYRSRHPDLINFSNAAFYGSRLIPMPPKDEQKAIRFFEVNGIYETHQGVNVSEAIKTIEILKSHLSDFKSGRYESIGIATLNMYQRNLILELIREQTEKDPLFASIIDGLVSAKNFFVKNLENIQGDEKDIIILSTTFGLTSAGTFIQNFGPLNQEKGYKLLNVIITRAKHKFYVCTSIPANFYLRYGEEVNNRGNVGKGIFYAYLAYAKSIEENNKVQSESILNLLSSKCAERVQSMNQFTESVFEQEVVDYLTEHIEPGRIFTQYQVGGFRIDIVITPLNGKAKPIAIECDGATYHSSSEAYAWDMFRQKRLEENGFIFYRIWSARWWENTEKEVKELIKFIERNS